MPDPVAPPPRSFISPVDRGRTWVSSPYGGRSGTHFGIDIAARPGQTNVPIVAAHGGTVVYRGVNGSLGANPSAGMSPGNGGRGYGNLVIVYHGVDSAGHHIYTAYGHLSSFNVNLGDTVTQGQPLGVMGNTGGSRGVHLHYTVFRSRDRNKLPLPASGRGPLNFWESSASISPTSPDPARAGSRDPYLEASELPPSSRNGGTGGPEMSAIEQIMYDELRAAAEAASQPPAWAASLINIVGSSVSGFLFKDKPLHQITTSAFINTVGLNLAQAIQQGGFTADYSLRLGNNEIGIKHNVLSNVGSEFLNAFRGAAIGSFSSFVAMELGNALGLKGFGAELVTTGASTVFGQVLNNAYALAQGGQAAANIGSNLFHGLNGQGLFGNAADPTKLAQWNVGLLPSAIGGFLGAKLGSLILSPTNTTGALLSSIGSAAGAWAFGAGAASAGAIGSIGASIATVFGTLGNVVAPFVGSLIGFLLGSLIGRLFGRKKPRTPSASAETYLDLSSGYWQLGAVTAANNGNRDLVSNMAKTARDSINSVISTLVGGDDIANVANTYSLTHKYGHTGQTLWMDEKVGSSWVRRYSGSDASQAVDIGSTRAIKATRISGGDIFLKRAIYSSLSTNLTSMYGNILAAEDYVRYLENKELVNQIIAENPNSAFAVGWFSTWARAEELGLNKFQASDFFGGLKGFADSFGFDAETALTGFRFAYENLNLTWEGANLRIATTDGSTPFWLLNGTNNIADQETAARSAYIANFGWNVGYNLWSGEATTGNDIYIASGEGWGVTIDDTYSYWQPNYHYDPYYYDPYYYDDGYWVTAEAGGDDIFVGSNYDDHLYGRSGYDWLDGGAGNDHVEGGEHDDVLIGGGGVDMLQAGNGNDYAAGGAGNDYVQSWIGGPAPGGIWGGYGNDTLVGGSGVDSLFGEAGDDQLIVDEDGGWEWDYFDGGAGIDTVSFERFSGGVGVDLRTGAGDGYTTRTYGDGWVSVENLTGGNFDDWLAGDWQSNLLRGLAGNDTIYGLEGDDRIEGGAGRDTMYGGSGIDTLSYQNSDGGVLVHMGTGDSVGGDAGDSFAEFENLTGSRYDDELTGDAGSNVIDGGKGDDKILWSYGYDTIIGGAGNDTYDASHADGGLTVYGSAYAYVNGVYSYLTSVEGFIGTGWGDWLEGTAGEEWFQGNGGNDYYTGGDGSDTYVFGVGDGYDSLDETANGHNSIIIENGVNWRDVMLSGVGGSHSLYIYLRPTWEYIGVNYNFVYGTNGAHNHKIKTLDIGGLSALDISAIDFVPYNAETDASTAVYGAQNKADLIFAYGGDDYIVTAGYAGGYEYRGNVIYAGDGWDTISSSAGDDQFIFERGNGVDTLYDSGGADTIVMGPSVAADDVIYEVVVTGYDGYGGQTGDLYIGLRDPNNPGLSASQVADRIRIVDGGTKMHDLSYGYEHMNTIEHVRVGGQEVELAKADIKWVTSYYQSYTGYDDPYDPYGDPYRRGGYIPPLAIDLDGDGIEMRSVEGSRISTVDADGKLWRVGWLGGDDGFLALDRDGNGVIDRLAEIQFARDLKGAQTDLEGLAAYDSNADGKLDARDARFGEFRVWRDKNQDGLGVGKELVTLTEAGIVSISLKGEATGFTYADGIDNTVLATTAIEWSDPNRVGLGYDVALAVRQVRSDEGGKEKAKAEKGDKADAVDARLYGFQAMTEAEVEAHKAGPKEHKPSEGRLGRVETFLAGADRDATGLLKAADPNATHEKNVKDAKDGDADAKKDRFANSDWTREAKPERPEKEKGRDPDFTPPAASPAHGPDKNADRGKAGLDAAIAHFDKQHKAAEAAETARAARDAEEQGRAPKAAPPPSAEEKEKRAKSDTFRLLDSGKGKDEAEWSPRKAEAGAAKSAAAASAPAGPQASSTPERAKDPVEAPQAAERQPAPAATSSATPPQQGAGGASTGAAAAPETDYQTQISLANAKLVQALGGFGSRAGMMVTNGLSADKGGEGNSPWLTVGQQASVHNLVQIG
jgi:Ca2+-binding RTX toxin-like protein